MTNATQENATEAKTLSITDENISQADYERLRNGETVEVEESAPATKASKNADESETSDLKAKDDSDDESGEESDEASDLEKPKKKSGTQRRIEKLVKQRAEVERERDELRAQLAKTLPPQEVKTPAPVVEGKPKSDDYESYDDYVEALTDWRAEQKLKARDEATQKEAKITQVKERVKTHNERVDAYRKDQPDFDKHLSAFFEDQGTDFNLNDFLQELITESDDGPAILHELVKNPEEFERINSLNDVGVARAIGRLEESLSKATEKKTTEIKTKTTKAPLPARPISATSANGKKSIYDDDISQAEYERMRAEQEKRRRV